MEFIYKILISVFQHSKLSYNSPNAVSEAVPFMTGGKFWVCKNTS